MTLEPSSCKFIPVLPFIVIASAVVVKSDAAPAPILTAPAASIVIVEFESKSCGPPLADNEPLKNRVSHLCASLPRLCESLAFGIISEVISAPKLTASESESPNVIVPLTIVFPLTCKSPATSTLPNEPVDVNEPDMSKPSPNMVFPPSIVSALEP